MTNTDTTESMRKTASGRSNARWLLVFACLIAISTYACASTGTRNDRFEQLLERAEEGRPSAQTELAFRYMTGRGMEKDQKQAARWYTASARQGDVVAMEALQDLGLPVPAPTYVTSSGGRNGGAGLSNLDLDFGNFHALVIGNADYQNLPKLETTTNDAKAVAKILRVQYGFDVTTLVDASWAQMRRALAELRKTLGENDNLLIYYAGHGWIDKKAGEAYWLPVDADSDSDVLWISNSTLATALRAIEARHVMIIADSCFSGTLTRGLSLNQDGRSFLDQLNSKRSRTAMTSGGVEPVTDGGKNGHSVFANAFLSALLSNSTVIDATALFAQIRRPVMVSADQTPSYGDIRKAGHEDGDFLFVRVADEAAEGR